MDDEATHEWVTRLEALKVDFDVEGNADRFALVGAGFKSIFGYSLQGFFVQTKTETSNDLQACREALLIDDEVDLDIAADLLVTGLLGEVRIDGVQEFRHGTVRANLFWGVKGSVLLRGSCGSAQRG